MTTRALQKIPLDRREALFTRIRQIVRDLDAADRSLAIHGEGLSGDDALADIVECLTPHKKKPRDF